MTNGSMVDLEETLWKRKRASEEPSPFFATHVCAREKRSVVGTNLDSEATFIIYSISCDSEWASEVFLSPQTVIIPFYGVIAIFWQTTLKQMYRELSGAYCEP